MSCSVCECEFVCVDFDVDVDVDVDSDVSEFVPGDAFGLPFRESSPFDRLLNCLWSRGRLGSS